MTPGSFNLFCFQSVSPYCALLGNDWLGAAVPIPSSAVLCKLKRQKLEIYFALLQGYLRKHFFSFMGGYERNKNDL